MIEITVDADMNHLDEIFAFVEQVIAPYHCSTNTRFQLEVALEEVYVNIANYAYPDEVGTTTIRCEVVGEKKPLLSLEILDQGKPYNPLARQDPDIELSAEARQIGGLGIYMVKNTMDTVSYRYESNCNIFVLQKYL